MDYIDELQKLGFQGFFILTKDARPIVFRSYSDLLPPINDKSSHEISGLIATMIQIAGQLSQHLGLLRDVALHTFRLFIDYWDNLIFVLVFDEQHYMDFKTSDVLLLMKGTISLVKESFQIVISESDTFESTDLLVLQEHISSVLETIDSVLYESYTKMLQTLNLELYNTRFTNV